MKPFICRFLLYQTEEGCVVLIFTYTVDIEDFPHRETEQTDSTAGVQGPPTQSSEGQGGAALRGRRCRSHPLQGNQRTRVSTTWTSFQSTPS